MRNFSANLAWPYVAATPTELPNAGDTYTANGVSAARPLFAAHHHQWRPLRVPPSFNIWSLGLRYRLPLVGRHRPTAWR
jgi:hypothetical protein